MKLKIRNRKEVGVTKVNRLKSKALGAWRALWAAVLPLLLAAPAFATGTFEESKIATGTKNLVSDVSFYLVILCPIVGGAFAVYYLIRRSMADETDGKMWTKRITTAIICGVLGALVSGIISLVAGYYA